MQPESNIIVIDNETTNGILAVSLLFMHYFRTGAIIYSRTGLLRYFPVRICNKDSQARNNVFNLDLEMHASFNTFFTGHKLDEAAFRFNHIKIEATGEVNDRLFYWYRQNLNQGNESMDLENLPESIEYAMIGYRLNDKFTITLGKQDAAWGGFEYDLDPYAIYEYSDMNEYMDCYFTGVTLGYQPTPSQELRLQVTDNRIGSMEDTRNTSRRNRKATCSAFLHI